MATAHASPPSALRPLGFVAATALVVGNMIGSGVFLLPASLAPYGGISLAGWLASGTGAVLLALVFARLARFQPAAGGPYAYARLAFGDFAGFLVAWVYWISVWSSYPALAIAAVGYLEPFFPRLVHDSTASAGLAIAFVWVFALLNLRSVRSVGQVQIATTLLKVLPLLAVGVAGLWWFDASHFAVVDHSLPAVGHNLSAAATLTLFAFLGLECATIPADHVVDASRTIPRATILGTIITGLICVVGTVGVMSVLSPATLAKSTAPFADAASIIAGPWAGRLIALGAAVSCLGALNGWTLIGGEMPRAVALDGVFPAIFARLSARGRPAFGIIVSAALATILVALNANQNLVAIFTFVLLLSTLGTLLPYALTALAGLLIRRADGSRVTETRRDIAVAFLAFAFSLWAVAGAGTDVVYWGFLLMLTGVPVYVWAVRGSGLFSTDSQSKAPRVGRE
jgi:APA family basic amino acid/polyamine antiporter